ncbi:MAG: sporulation protein YqfD [Clostridia bacterium]|nr:sporulation protein YqfD [Clostridia bacterium]
MSFFLSRRYTLETEKKERTLTALITSGIDFSSPRKEEKGISFSAPFFAKKKITRFADERGLPLTHRAEGILSRLFFLKKRIGLVFGGILSFFLIYLSTFYVWSVRIEGNEELSDARIKTVMMECGFFEGVKKSEVDINELQNEVLQRCHELSFFSVNVHGMVADVVVHERRTTVIPTERNVPYNLVADMDGVVVSSVILDGQAMFKVGDTVAKGELLVSGIVDSTAEGFRLRQAEGKVYARTSRIIELSLPFEYFEKRLIKEEKTKKIRILGHSIGKSVGDDSGSYDISTSEKEASLFGFLLPFSIEEHKASYYKNEKSTLSPLEVRAELLDSYKRYLSTELDSGTVLGEKLVFSEDEEKMTLTAEVVAIENIAVKQKININ